MNKYIQLAMAWQNILYLLLLTSDTKNDYFILQNLQFSSILTPLIGWHCFERFSPFRKIMVLT